MDRARERADLYIRECGNTRQDPFGGGLLSWTPNPRARSDAREIKVNLEIQRAAQESVVLGGDVEAQKWLHRLWPDRYRRAGDARWKNAFAVSGTAS